MKVLLQTAQMPLEACGTSPVLRINSFQQRREKVKVLVAQSCPTLCEPMHCSLLDSSIHGILQARILERVTLPFFSRSSLPRDQIQVSCICRQILTCLSHQIINQNLASAWDMSCGCSSLDSTLLASFISLEKTETGNQSSIFLMLA